jgi:hypothetical protein
MGISRSKEKRNQKRETTIVSIEMLEGAKLIGAGAATIALAGAAVGIGIVCFFFPLFISMFIAGLKKRRENVSSFFFFYG